VNFMVPHGDGSFSIPRWKLAWKVASVISQFKDVWYNTPPGQTPF
jgi:hypothetical protein